MKSFYVLAVHLRVPFLSKPLHDMLTHSGYSIRISAYDGGQAGVIDFRQLRCQKENGLYNHWGLKYFEDTNLW